MTQHDMTEPPKNSTQLSITAPRRFTPRAIAIISLFGLGLMAPVLGAILLVSVVQLALYTVVLPLSTIAAVTFFLPLGFGNPYVSKLVRAIHPDSDEFRKGFIVQLTFRPRLRRGLGKWIEDADDFGRLVISGSAVEFYGDSIRLSLPFEQIQNIRSENIGWRGLFVYGAPVTLEVSGLPTIAEIQVAERSSIVLPGSRRTAKEMNRQLSACVKGKH